MRNSILENCGSHTDKLMEISELIYSRKKLNGEPLTKDTIVDIDQDIYEAYQSILSNLRDGASIEKAIQYLENEVENGGATTNIKTIADSVSQKVIIENENRVSNNKENVAEAVIAAAVVNKVVETDGLKLLDNVFDEATILKMDVEIEKAKQGDEKAAAGMVNYEKAMAFMAKNPKLNEKTERGALAWMMNLSVNESELSEKALIDMATQYGFDILDTGKDGSVSVNKEKLGKLYEEKIKVVNPKAAERGVKSFEELSEKRGKKALEDGRFNGNENAQNSVLKIKKKVTNSHEAYLDELIEQYNAMQQKGASQDKILEVQRKINVMSEVVKKEREAKAKDASTQSVTGNKHHSNKEDEEPSL